MCCHSSCCCSVSNINSLQKFTFVKSINGLVGGNFDETCCPTSVIEMTEVYCMDGQMDCWSISAPVQTGQMNKS